MQAVRKTAPRPGARPEACPEATAPGPDEIILSIAAAGICGSDLHAYDWDGSYGFMAPFLPLTLGHEFSGRVTALGPAVKDLSLGAPVVCWPTIPCGTCPGCTAGQPIYCTERRILGLHRDGGFATELRLPAANALPLPPGLPLDVAALAEPLGVSINAVNVAGGGAGQRVLVLGPGMIGFGIALIAAARGAEVMLAGFDDAPRLRLAAEMGLHRTVDLKNTGLDAALAGFGAPDVVFEATGRPASVTEGLRVLRPGGVLGVVGIHAEPASIDLTALVRGKKQIRGCHDTTPEAFAEAIRRLAAAPDFFARLITHRLPLEDFETGFALAKARSALKVMLLPNGGQDA